MEIRVGSLVGAIKAGEKAPVSARQEWLAAPTCQHAAPIPPLQIGDAKQHRHQLNRDPLFLRFAPTSLTSAAAFSTLNYFLFRRRSINNSISIFDYSYYKNSNKEQRQEPPDAYKSQQKIDNK